MRIALICMPWAALDAPSLGLSVLKPVADSVPGVTAVDIKYGNLEFMNFVMLATDSRITAEQYAEIAEGYFVAAGEWIFSGALYDDQPDPTTTAFYEIAARSGSDLDVALRLYGSAEPFIEAYARQLAAQQYDVYGFSSSFLQNAPSLALAKALRLQQPKCRIVFGGANCDGVQGAALHRNFPFVDYVVRGEGEQAFSQLLNSSSREAAVPT